MVSLGLPEQSARVSTILFIATILEGSLALSLLVLFYYTCLLLRIDLPGLQKFFREWREDLSMKPDPRFKNTELIEQNPKWANGELPHSMNQGKGSIDSESLEKANNAKNEKRRQRLRQLKKFVEENPDATLTEMAASVGVTSKTVRSYLSEIGMGNFPRRHGNFGNNQPEISFN